MRILSTPLPLPTLAAALALLPGAALAGSPMVVVSGAGAVTQVPTMSENMLIAVGVLLAIVGLRFLQQRGGGYKVLSILVLGSGLVVGGLGIEKTQATDAGFSDGSTACGGGTESQSIRDPFTGGLLFNSCSETDLTVVAYQGYPCSPENQVKVDADVGDTIPAGGTATLNSCPE